MKINSYNVRGLPKTKSSLALRADICDILHESDILVCQETWYCNEEIKFLNSIHKDFYGAGVSSRSLADGILHGHAPGGVAILWKKSLNNFVKHLTFPDCNWCNGLEVSLGSKRFIILNVYLPYQCHENEAAFNNCLGMLSAIIDDLDCTCFAILGDWNANLITPSMFSHLVRNFVVDNDLIFSSESMLPRDSFTFVSEAHNSVSWLDYAVCSSDFHAIITDLVIHYAISCEDHIPFSCVLEVDKIPDIDVPEQSASVSRICWDKVSDDNISEYQAIINSEISKLLEASCASHFNCTNLDCSNNEHISALLENYNALVSILISAGTSVFPKKSSHCNSHNVPGWTEFVNDMYQESRAIRKSWVEAGRPMQGTLYETYKSIKAQCKYTIRKVKANEDSIRSDSLASKLLNCDQTSFWKEIKHMNASKVPLPSQIDGVEGAAEIAERWKVHFHNLFNCINDSECTQLDVDLSTIFSDVKVSVTELQEAISTLDHRKSCGSDDIYPQHLLYAPASALNLLTSCFTSMLVHGVLPESLLDVTIIPIIKNKAGNINSIDNYRPIAIASVLSKILEKILLSRLEVFLITTSNQFGFKKKHSTDQCIYLLKEIVQMYSTLNSSVFLCFLDASKAFDRVNHRKLFNLMKVAGIPGYIIRILVFWYSSQRMCIRWGSTHSDFFHVSNGVRQGGILSPYLFCFYVNNLSSHLNSVNTGCIVGNSCINHLMYADDLVLISPSVSGMDELLKGCEEFAAEHDVLFNASKSVSLMYLNSSLKGEKLPPFYLNGAALPISESTKYLGHILNSNQRDDEDIVRQCRTLCASANTLIRKFYMCSPSIKLKLFNAFCAPLYTSHLWWNFHNYVYKRFSTQFNSAIKRLLNYSKFDSTSLICSYYGIRSCQEMLRHFVYKFRLRVQSCPNDLISAFRNSMYYLTSECSKYHVSLLYSTF